jgi:hypothetical protein
VRVAVALVLVCAFAQAGRAEVMRLRWRGVEAAGSAPAKLDRAIGLHLAIALKQLGTELAAAAPVDAEAGARCSFAGKTASCVVDVVHLADGVRVERKQDIPFRDADDLAESLSLLVAEMVQTDLREIVTPREEPKPPEPPPQPRPKPIAKVAPPPSTDGEPSRDTPPARTHSTIRKTRPAPSHGIIEVGPTVAFGFTGEPVLAGAVIRGGWARGALRVGGTLSFTGNDADRGGYSFTFLRLLTGARVGVGFDRPRVEGELGVGPGLLVLTTDAHQYGTHTLTTFAGVVGARLGVRLSTALELALSVDAAVAASRQQVTAGGMPVTQLDLGSLEVALMLAYRL